MKLLPWDAGDPSRVYVRSEHTDVRKTWAAERKKIKEKQELAARRARKQLREMK